MPLVHSRMSRIVTQLIASRGTPTRAQRELIALNHALCDAADALEDTVNGERGVAALVESRDTLAAEVCAGVESLLLSRVADLASKLLPLCVPGRMRVSGPSLLPLANERQKPARPWRTPSPSCRPRFVEPVGAVLCASNYNAITPAFAMLRPNPPHTQLDMVKGALKDAEEEIACMEKVLQCALMVVRHRS